MSYIRYLRKKNHLTQTQLAEILGVTQTSVSQWESGRNFPDIKTARRLAEYFNTTLDQIMSLTDGSVRRAELHRLYEDRIEGGVFFNDVTDLELKRKLLTTFDQLSPTARLRILERAEAYLEVEQLSSGKQAPGSMTVVDEREEEHEADVLDLVAENQEGDTAEA